MGVGDRFAHQARAQLQAFTLAARHGVNVVPVWNKSNREHLIVGSHPASVRAAAEAAVRQLDWRKPFHVDADHINLSTVDAFLADSDYYTLDVADAIGKLAPETEVSQFVDRHPELTTTIELPGIAGPITLSRTAALQIASKYLFATQEAARIYRRIEVAKSAGQFITEVSMDETDNPQTPAELLVILAALADAGVPVQAIAPKFTGRFNKGVDYQGDVAQFESEFHADMAVLSYAARRYGFPRSLKLRVHSGSDKFSIYPAIRRGLRKFDAGVHLKTAGTTWLEELIGLAEGGGEGLLIAKEVYCGAWSRRDELCAPYAAVIDIDPSRLPSPEDVEAWSGPRFADALRHNEGNPEYNPDLRQLLHVGYKVAAGMGNRYLEALERYQEPVSRNVTLNLFARHIVPVFLEN
jgi:hypothetical protein